MMFNVAKPSLSGVAIDVILLAVLVALHMTKKDQNVKLLLTIVLVTHVVMTTDNFLMKGGKEQPVVDQPIKEVEVTIEKPLGESKSLTPELKVEKERKDISDGEFTRQFSSPDQLTRTLEILPTSGAAANSKLVDARTSFYSDIIDLE